MDAKDLQALATVMGLTMSAQLKTAHLRASMAEHLARCQERIIDTLSNGLDDAREVLKITAKNLLQLRETYEFGTEGWDALDLAAAFLGMDDATREVTEDNGPPDWPAVDRLMDRWFN